MATDPNRVCAALAISALLGMAIMLVTLTLLQKGALLKTWVREWERRPGQRAFSEMLSQNPPILTAKVGYHPCVVCR